ncbi:MAG: TetR/AcrR family transcriptional regulator [Oscillospiraceae bacterium]|nr:TetR/AcrR family transcriptional regulator [Oscillospiraceae bacterium]
MNRSNNLRFQKTEQRILDCAVHLLETEPDSVLTVSAVCEELSINRSSFYIHHRSIQSVLDAIQTRYHAEHLEQLARENVLSEESPTAAAIRLCIDFILERHSFYAYYAKYSGNHSLLGQHSLECLELLTPGIQSCFALSDSQLAYLGEFIQGGIVAVMKRSLSGSREDSAEEIGELFAAIIRPLEEQVRENSLP